MGTLTGLAEDDPFADDASPRGRARAARARAAEGLWGELLRLTEHHQDATNRPARIRPLLDACAAAACAAGGAAAASGGGSGGARSPGGGRPATREAGRDTGNSRVWARRAWAGAARPPPLAKPPGWTAPDAGSGDEEEGGSLEDDPGIHTVSGDGGGSGGDLKQRQKEAVAKANAVKARRRARAAARAASRARSQARATARATAEIPQLLWAATESPDALWTEILRQWEVAADATPRLLTLLWLSDTNTLSVPDFARHPVHADADADIGPAAEATGGAALVPGGIIATTGEGGWRAIAPPDDGDGVAAMDSGSGRARARISLLVRHAARVLARAGSALFASGAGDGSNHGSDRSGGGGGGGGGGSSSGGGRRGHTAAMPSPWSGGVGFGGFGTGTAPDLTRPGACLHFAHAAARDAAARRYLGSGLSPSRFCRTLVCVECTALAQLWHGFSFRLSALQQAREPISRTILPH